MAEFTRGGRQGDKVKRALIEMGCIEEIEKLTATGRKKVLRLTEKGIRTIKEA